MSTMKTLVLAASATLVTLLSSVGLADEDFSCKTPVKGSTRCGDANTNIRLEAGQAVYVVLVWTEEEVCVNFAVKHAVDSTTNLMKDGPIKVCPIDGTITKKKDQDKEAKLVWKNTTTSTIDVSLIALTAGTKGDKKIQGRIIIKKP
jgi:hypothetical protein